MLRGTGGNHAFYLSIPPRYFGDVIGQLKEHGLADGTQDTWRRVVIEKPFGSNLKTARELNAVLSDVFPPESVFRIDHYLGKETVQNILAMRFANMTVRADLELQLRRPRADHHGRGHRHRRSGRLLRRHRRGPRRHPEPPHPADGADRDGGADLVRVARACARRS